MYTLPLMTKVLQSDIRSLQNLCLDNGMKLSVSKPVVVRVALKHH
jgi:hypothetical protein